MYVIEDGLFTLEDKATNTFAKDESFAEMREAGISHTGQVETAILESNGKVSFFYYEDDKVIHGMPILPKPYTKRSKDINSEGYYSCTYCAYTEERAQPGACPRCQHEQWVQSINTKRVT